MPHLTLRDADLYFEDTGPGAETIVFSHGLLLDCRQYDALVAAFRGRYRCLAFDHRGQGRSSVTRAGYDMDALAEDAAALLRATNAGPCHFVGSSMGGFVGMRLAVKHPELLRSLTLIGTSASPEANPWGFRVLCWAATCFGVRAVTSSLMSVQFGPAFLRDPSRVTEREAWRRRMASTGRIGAVRAAGGVIARPDFTGQLKHIATPTLVVVGTADEATPPAEARRLHQGISGSTLVEVPGAGHAVAIERPDAVAAAMRPFLDGVTNE